MTTVNVAMSRRRVCRRSVACATVRANSFSFSLCRSLLFIFTPRGFAPRTPLHALSRAASSARSDRVVRFAALAHSFEGLRPSDFSTRALASRFVGSLPPPREALRRDLAEALATAGRSRGSLRCARSLFRGASPLGLLYTRSREPLRRLASASARSATARPRRSLGDGGPIAWFASLRSLTLPRSFASRRNSSARALGFACSR